MDKKVFVCVGLPCSGKGTQSRILAEKINAQRIESGARINMIARGEIYPDLQEVAQIVRTHPGEITVQERNALTRAQLGDPQLILGDNIVLDGFGRNFPQYDILCEVFGRERLIFLLFHITKDIMFQRAESRWVHPITNESFSNLSEKEAQVLGYIKRRNDIPEILERRFRSFEKNTKAVLVSHRKKWLQVIEIDATSSSVEDVTQNMIAKIGNLV